MFSSLNIKQKTIAIFFLFFLFAPLAGIFYLDPLMTRQHLDEAKRTQAELARHIAMNLDNYLNDTRHEIESLSSLIESGPLERERLDSILAQANHTTPFYKTYYITDSDGVWVSFPQNPGFVGKSLPSESIRWIKRTIETNGTSGMDVNVSRVGTLTSGFAVPLHQGGGRPRMVLRGVIDLTEDNPLLSLTRKIRVGEKGYAYIVSSRGRLIAHPDYDMKVEDLSQYDFNEYLPVSSLKGSGEGMVEYDYGGVRWLASYRRVEATGWGVIVQQPKLEVVRLARLGTGSIISYSFITFSLGIIILVLSLHYNLRPLYRLIDNIKKKELKPVGQLKDDEVGRIEMEFREIYCQLTESEGKFRSYIENAPTGVFIADGNGNYLEVNQSACATTGYQPEELLMMNIADLVPEEQRQQAMAAFRELKSRVKSTTELEFVRKDGSRGWWIVDAVKLADDRYMGFTTDITRRKSLEEEEFRNRNLESLGLLAGGIAHDFNNKLGSILNNIYLAKTYLDSNHKASRKLEEIERVFWQTTSLTEQLMTFSKGGISRPEVFDIGELVKSVTEFALSGSKVACHIQLPGEVLTVNADKGQISQVISNIVINAKEAMPSGGELKVVVSRQTGSNGETGDAGAAGLVRIAFEDSGPGISRENLGRIFAPFFSTKKSGRGIGLTTSHSIINKFSGSIDVRSQEGKGASFLVYLPEAGLPADEAEHRGHLMLRAGLNVLVMDDDESFRRSLCGIIGSLGSGASEAANGQQALELYRESVRSGRAFDLVILDLTVPGEMGGVDTLRGLKAIDPDVRAIVMSGYSDEIVITEYEKYGFMGALIKPFNYEQLAGLLSANIM